MRVDDTLYKAVWYQNQQILEPKGRQVTRVFYIPVAADIPMNRQDTECVCNANLLATARLK